MGVLCAGAWGITSAAGVLRRGDLRYTKKAKKLIFGILLQTPWGYPRSWDRIKSRKLW